MIKTQAVVLRKGGQPWEITELDLDGPKAGEVLVRRGAPGYRYATTPHPVAVLTPDQVKQRAAQVLDDVMNLLTEPE
jgi:hypothetical protein